MFNRYQKGFFFTVFFAAAMVFLIAAITGCSGSSNLIGSEKLSDENFSKYKTYAFSPTNDTSYTKIINKREFEINLGTSVIEQLSKRGMNRDTINPDCVFTYKLILNRKYGVNQSQEVVYSPQYYNGAYNPQYYNGFAPNNYQVVVFSSDNKPAVYNGKMNIDTLREGSIVIDMIDPKENKVVWRATAGGERKESYKQPPKELIDELVKAMFKKFPKK